MGRNYNLINSNKKYFVAPTVNAITILKNETFGGESDHCVMFQERVEVEGWDKSKEFQDLSKVSDFQPNLCLFEGSFDPSLVPAGCAPASILHWCKYQPLVDKRYGKYIISARDYINDEGYTELKVDLSPTPVFLSQYKRNKIWEAYKEAHDTRDIETLPQIFIRSSQINEFADYLDNYFTVDR